MHAKCIASSGQLTSEGWNNWDYISVKNVILHQMNSFDKHFFLMICNSCIEFYFNIAKDQDLEYLVNGMIHVPEASCEDSSDSNSLSRVRFCGGSPRGTGHVVGGRRHTEGWWTPPPDSWQRTTGTQSSASVPAQQNHSVINHRSNVKTTSSTTSINNIKTTP